MDKAGRVELEEEEADKVLASLRIIRDRLENVSKKLDSTGANLDTATGKQREITEKVLVPVKGWFQ